MGEGSISAKKANTQSTLLLTYLWDFGTDTWPGASENQPDAEVRAARFVRKATRTRAHGGGARKGVGTSRQAAAAGLRLSWDFRPFY